MVDRFNDWLIRSYLSSCGILSEFDKERIKYSMNLLLNEAEKIMLLILLFGVTGQLKVFIFSFAVLMSIRAFVGGIHLSTRCRCFSFTLLFFSTAMVLSNFVLINPQIKLVVCGLSLINTMLCAPLPSKHRVLVLERGRDILRKRSVTMVLIWIVASVMLGEKLSNVIVWTIAMQQMELLYYKIFLSRKEEMSHEN